MKPFLEELAEKIVARGTTLEGLTMVFPNRRAALFFRHYLSLYLKDPSWAPNLITIEELFAGLSTLQEADKLSLIFRLYRVYLTVMQKEESFDRFYFWGDMLLKDFDELDKYMAPATNLFKDLSNWRELDDSFDTLTEEQKKFLKDFWINFGDKPIGNKEEFLKVWRLLPQVYTKFVKELRAENIGYGGMIHRAVADQFLSGKQNRTKKASASSSNGKQMIFAGFNALTRSEEVLISRHVENGAEVFWDLDPYYTDDVNQEAGLFFRQYRKHKILGSTFDSSALPNFRDSTKIVNLYGVPQKAGQAKLLGQILEKEILPTLPQAGGTSEEVKTVIVLPDETLLLSVMHSLPEALDSINVTMGYPLRSTPVYNLLELLVELQIHRKDAVFSHRQVTAILGHPYVLSLQEEKATALRLKIITTNSVYVNTDELQEAGGIINELFKPIDAENITSYLLDIVQYLGAGFTDEQSFDKEYAFHFHNTLARLSEILKDSGSQLDLKGFQKLFRQVVQSEKIPFTGEPLKGLQIMGVLETRNLDFDNVFILSLNEGSLPAAQRQGSYIPHAIRKAYGLPTHDHQDAMYAYLFYRVLQRAKNIRLFYNTEPDILGMGEMSRFVQQLIYESGWKINHHILSNPIGLKEVNPINVAKTPEVLKTMERYTNKDGNGISPSAINDYIECSLRFYLKHLANLREADEVQEDLDARIFGNFLHNVMDWFYNDLTQLKNSKLIEPSDLEPTKVTALLDVLIDRAFHKHYNLKPQVKIDYVGQRVVVKAIVLQFAQRILLLDKAYAPFSIELLEEKKFTFPISLLPKDSQTVIVGGRIDRVDSKDGLLRVIDYKTGRDELAFEGIDSLFAREGKRNKAAFQTILYAWLYHHNKANTGAIRPVLMNRKNLFLNDVLHNFKMGGNDVIDIRFALQPFEENLRKLLSELFDPEIEFFQTPEIENCKYCDFKNMCRRQ